MLHSFTAFTPLVFVKYIWLPIVLLGHSGYLVWIIISGLVNGFHFRRVGLYLFVWIDTYINKYGGK